MAFSERLKELRAEKGLSQGQLAKITGITKGQIGRWETSFLIPSKKNLDLLSAALGVKADELRFPGPKPFGKAELDALSSDIASLSVSNQLLVRQLVRALGTSQKIKEQVITTAQ